MNEINFNVEDIEQVDLSIGMGIKEIYPPIENLEVTPSKEQQVFKHENSYGYDEVVVEPIPDEYIIPNGTLPITENATYDVRKFARVSTSVHPAPNLQEKELTINENGTYNITADEEYDGLNQVSVTVDAIEDLTEELETYNTELTEQETTINDIVETLKTKAIGGGGSSMEIYSKEEVQIGTWIDGKPIYRKVVEYGALHNQEGMKYIEHGISNIDKITNITIIGYLANNAFPIPSVANIWMFGETWMSARINDKQIGIYVSKDSSDKTAIVTLEYTKTTD